MSSAEIPPAREIVPETLDDLKPFDPWAHRRTEPRPLAFYWSMFLALATMIALGSVAASGIITHDVYRPAARGVLALIAIGVTVLWPMLRLSQTVPALGSRGWIAKDLVVLLAPAQAVIWPQGLFFLAAWPWSVVGAISAVIAAWALLIGAVLAIACDRVGSHPGISRTRWMGVLLCVGILGPAVSLSMLPAPRASRPDMRMMMSAPTAVFEIARDREWSGKSAAVFRGHWWGIGMACAVGALVWFLPKPSGKGRGQNRDPIGVGSDRFARLDSGTTGTPQQTSKDPGLPGAG